MKYCLLFMLVIPIYGFSQISLKTNQDTLNVLCSDWQLLLTEKDGEKIPVDTNEQKLFLIKKNGKYQMIAFDLTINGTWKLDNAKKLFITRDEEGQKKWTIVKISSGELIMQTKTEDGNIKVFLKARN